MKYMGSKRYLLRNGLGELVLSESRESSRFIDLFSGSTAVAQFVAERVAVEVVAVDLQAYSRALARPILSRTEELDADFVDAFVQRVEALRTAPILMQLEKSVTDSPDEAGILRVRRAAESTESAICRAYGGHYYGLMQSLTLDAALAALPRRRGQQDVLLAAIIEAASKCAAAPGHTAQPFAPTESGLPHIVAAWGKDPLPVIESHALAACGRHARILGKAYVADAEKSLSWLRPTPSDIVFLDPPYSAVQYSRFYHVLETLALGRCGAVTGRGRYPDPSLRPRSDYSLRTKATAALSALLSRLAKTGARVILTFPAHDCSNALSGEKVIAIAERDFRVRQKRIENSFSTLGGTAKDRGARQPASELVLLLEPRKA